MVCRNCSGFIGEKNKAYCYSGKWCNCQNPKEIDSTINSPFNISQLSTETIPQMLFDKIKHGDVEHKEWLAKELEEFFNVKINR